MAATVQDSVLLVRQRYSLPPILLTANDRTQANLATRFERINDKITIDRRGEPGKETIEALIASAEKGQLL